MSKTVLITGASGLIGRPLTQLLVNTGYNVHQLSRDISKANKNVKIFHWEVSRMSIDDQCINNVDAIINLAGEGIVDKAWTSKRKKQIIKSRTDSILLLNDLLKRKSNQVKTFISSSAVGHYGDRGNEILTEESEPGTDFLSNTCLAWERAADKIMNMGLRLVVFRTGVVLSTQGGALPQLARPVKLGLGSALGTGKQWIPWIHIDDVVQMFLYALENENVKGLYNMAAPFPVTNHDFTHALAQQLKRPLWLPRVPELALKILMGEMSSVILNSNRTSVNKIEQTGFKFKHPEISDALKDLYG